MQVNLKEYWKMIDHVQQCSFKADKNDLTLNQLKYYNIRKNTTKLSFRFRKQLCQNFSIPSLSKNFNKLLIWGIYNCTKIWVVGI